MSLDRTLRLRFFWVVGDDKGGFALPPCATHRECRARAQSIRCHVKMF